MFALSQIADVILLPSNLIALLGLAAALALASGFRKLGVGGLLTAALLLAIFGWTPVGAAALIVLENRFPAPEIRGPVAGVVMLGGAVDTHIAHDRRAVTLTDAAERVTAVAELAERYPQARILLSGGASDLLAPEPATESSLARDLLVAMGVPARRIELEERSRNTCENAIESKRVAQPRADDRWLLVTSASHMPRAVACFRAVDFPVLPYPVDYRTRGRADLRRPSASIAAGLAASDLAAHEWVGLLLYRLTRTHELFPAPQEALPRGTEIQGILPRRGRGLRLASHHI
jgi:uncharacterized SAM-binding protein YcdF (DUF218 family)